MRTKFYISTAAAMAVIVGLASLYWYGTKTDDPVLTPLATIVLFPAIVLTGGIHSSPPWPLLFAIDWCFLTLGTWGITKLSRKSK